MCCAIARKAHLKTGKGSNMGFVTKGNVNKQIITRIQNGNKHPNTKETRESGKRKDPYRARKRKPYR